MRIDTASAKGLFSTLFLPFYPDSTQADLAKARALDANPAQNPLLYQPLEQAAAVFEQMARHAFLSPLLLDQTDASVHRLGLALTREQRDQWLCEQGPDGVSVLAHVVIHGVAYMGSCVVRNHGGIWQLRQPLWESLVRLRSRAGEADLALFSWWLRALSDPEIGRGTLADRYRLHVEVPCSRPEELPMIASPERVLPRLHHPRYETLFKYLRAHLPELRDLGHDFPSPERFAEFSFEWIDFALLGAGCMVLMHGPTEQGVYLIWLDATGFAKSAYYPADARPEHQVHIEGEKICLSLSLLGKPLVHEMLWWGP